MEGRDALEVYMFLPLYHNVTRRFREMGLFVVGKVDMAPHPYDPTKAPIETLAGFRADESHIDKTEQVRVDRRDLEWSPVDQAWVLKGAWGGKESPCQTQTS